MSKEDVLREKIHVVERKLLKTGNDWMDLRIEREKLLTELLILTRKEELK